MNPNKMIDDLVLVHEHKHNGINLPAGARMPALPLKIAAWLIDKGIARRTGLVVPGSGVTATSPARAALLSRPRRRGCCGGR